MLGYDNYNKTVNPRTLVVYEHSRLGSARHVGYQLVYNTSSWNVNKNVKCCIVVERIPFVSFIRPNMNSRRVSWVSKGLLIVFEGISNTIFSF